MSSIEENLQSKVILTLVTFAALFFAAKKVIDGAFLDRVVTEFTVDRMAKLCFASFVVQTGLANIR